MVRRGRHLTVIVGTATSQFDDVVVLTIILWSKEMYLKWNYNLIFRMSLKKIDKAYFSCLFSCLMFYTVFHWSMLYISFSILSADT